jgi:uncharacterized lipoprotein YbaY
VERTFRRNIKLKNLSIVLAISVFLIACGEQKVEDQQTDVKMEKQDIKMDEPEVVEPDNSLLENSATISGDITYDDEVVLPENARLVVRILDISKPEDRPTTLLSEFYILEGPPPYSYELNYEKSLINEKGSYALWAAIELGRDPLFRGGRKLGLFPDADVTLSLNLVEVEED